MSTPTTPTSDPATDTLVVTPQNVTVPAGDSITFVAPNETVEGTPVSGPVEWTVSGGSAGMAFNCERGSSVALRHRLSAALL